MGSAHSGLQLNAAWIGACALTVSAAASGADALPDLVRSGQRDAALERIEAGQDVDARAADGATALHWAAHRGDAELVERLLARGAAVDIENDYGITPLAAAAVEADRRIVLALLDAGADVESATAEGQTALMAVARTGQVETAQLLLERGADVNARERWGGQSALMWAAAQQQAGMIALLISYGAEVDARGHAHEWERKVTAEPRIKIMQTGGFTPLLYAAREGCVACVEALVAGGADIDLGDPYGMTPLLLALHNRHFDTAGRLIELGADVNKWDWWGRSPLFIAIDMNLLPNSRRGDLPALDELRGFDVARMLLARGANVNMRLKQQPPLRSEPGDRGFTDGDPDVLVITIGATPLHSAAKASDDESVRLLLDHGADADPANVFGITPLLAAAGVGHKYGLFKEYPIRGRWKSGRDAVATIELLLAAGARLEARSGELAAEFQQSPLAGLTAAHGAAGQGWNEVLLLLDELGVDVGAVSDDGSTPRDLALAAEHDETVALLDSLTAARDQIRP